MSEFNLVQLNIAEMKYPLESPAMSDFIAGLDQINRLAENSPGFVWRLIIDEEDTTSVEIFGANILVNMSIWTDIESLHNFIYRTTHAEFLGRRKEWFKLMKDVYSVLWWLPKGSTPTLAEAKEKLLKLRLQGPTEHAFTFKKAFPAQKVGQ